MADIVGTSGDDPITGTPEDDNIQGGAGNDTLDGGDGNDLLDGGAGSDYMVGGAGDDIYVIDGSDGVAEEPGAGTDEIRTSVDWGLQDNVENLTAIEGSEIFYLGGNDLDNAITGNSGDNYLVGSGGNDTLDGGEGNDVAAFRLPPETIGSLRMVDGPDGTLLVQLVHEDGSSEDVFSVAISGSGAATVTGLGTMAAEGSDTVANIEQLHFYVDGSSVESQFVFVPLTASADGDWVSGSAGDDAIDLADYPGASNVDGGLGDDVIIGNSGDNFLIGRGGSDTIEGGEGRDAVSFHLPYGTTGSLRIIDGEDGNFTVQLVQEDGTSQDVFAVSMSGNGAATVTGLGIAAELGTDTVTNVEELQFSVESWPEPTPDNQFATLSIATAQYNEWVAGSDGGDTINLADYPGATSADGGRGDDVIIGDSADNYLIGQGGDDTIDGGAGNDIAAYHLPADTVGSLQVVDGPDGTLLVQLAQDDGSFENVFEIAISGSGAASVTGLGMMAGLGTDTVSNIEDLHFFVATDPTPDNQFVHVPLAAWVPPLEDGFAHVSGSAVGEVIDLAALYPDAGPEVNINAFAGGGDDTILGTAGFNYLRGEAGDDTIDGRGGGDTVAFALPEGLAGTLQVVQGSGEQAGMLVVERVDGDTHEQLFLVSIAEDGTATVQGINSAESLGTDTVSDVSTLDFLIGEGSDGQFTNISVPHGTDGPEPLYGWDGSDAIAGGAGGDALYGFDGDDLLRAGDGSDFLRGGAGDDYIDGGAGHDRASFYDSAVGVHVDLRLQGQAQDTGQGMDTLVGIETVSGTVNDDMLIGDDNANSLWGSGGNDTLSGNGGDDYLGVTAGDHLLDGGDGSDTIAFVNEEQDAPGPVTVDLNIPGPQSTGIGTWTISNVENVSGGNFNDRITGNDADNILAGAVGNDTLIGGAGNDLLLGDGYVGVDTSDPSRSYFIIEDGAEYGAVGNDTLRGGDGDDTIFGGSGNDRLFGDAGDDYIDAGAGDDTIQTGFGTNVVYAADGYDSVLVLADSDLSDTLYVTGSGGYVNVTQGGAITNQIFAAEMIQVTAQGSTAPLTIDATGYISEPGSFLWLVDHNGTDIMLGSSGSEGFGNTYVNVTGNDIFTGNGGADIFDYTFAVAGMNGDIVTDFDFDDIIDLGYNDSVNNGGGLLADTFIGSAGFSGVAGEYRYSTHDGETFVEADTDGDGVADQVLTLANGEYALTETFFGSNVLVRVDPANPSTATEGSDLIDGTDQDDVIDGLGGDDILRGGLGNDELFGGDGDDVLEGGNDNDRLSGGFGHNVLTGGAGADEFEAGEGQTVVTDFTVGVDQVDLTDMNITSFAQLQPYLSQVGQDVVFSRLYGGVPQTLTLANVNLADLTAASFHFKDDVEDNVRIGTEQSDDLFGAYGADQLVGLGGDDYLFGGSGDDSLDGGADNDIVDGGEGADHAFGGGGNDTVFGRAGNDTLDGGDGDDWLNGGGGDDVLDGGAGNDTLFSGFGINELRGGDGYDIAYAQVDSSLSDTVYVTGIAGDVTITQGGTVTNHVLDAEEVQVRTDGGPPTTLTIDASGYVGTQDTILWLVDHDGTDIMIGSAGNDSFGNTAINVTGSDVFTGFGGSDLFDYTYAVGGMNGDTITDFEFDETIDLRFNDSANLQYEGALLADTFIGNAEFSGVAGEYRYSAHDGETFVEADTDGDAVADQVLTLANGEFVLVETFAGSNILKQAASGVAADGLLAGATVFMDANGDGQWNEGEARTTTGADGRYLFDSPSVGTLVVSGGINTDTGLPNLVTMRAPIGSGVVNPLTTLVQAVLESSPAGTTADDAAAAVAASLGISPSIDLLNTDVYSAAAAGDATALEAQKAAATVVALIAATTDAGGSAGAGDQAIANLAGLIGNGDNPIDLTDEATIAQVLEGAVAPDQVDSVASGVSDAAEQIAETTSLDQLSDAQADALTRGNDLDNVLIGGSHNDELFGFAGDDHLDGGAGADLLDGGADNDTVDYSASSAAVSINFASGKYSGGDAAGDMLISIENVTGSAYADKLIGNQGANVLNGGAGGDTINGGGGADVLWGGAGSDLFVFKTPGEISTSSAHDVLMDFEAGGSSSAIDHIDLSAIDAIAGSKKNDAFTFVGDHAFSGKAGELQVVTQNGVGMVSGDVDGDGRADFTIEVHYTGSLGAADIFF